MEKWLKDLFPILEVQNDCILSKQGDITLIYRVQHPEIFTVSNEEIAAFQQSWVKAINILPQNSILCKLVWFIDSKFKADFIREDNSFLSRFSERFFHERSYLNHSFYIFLTKKPDDHKPPAVCFPIYCVLPLFQSRLLIRNWQRISRMHAANLSEFWKTAIMQRWNGLGKKKFSVLKKY